jgi:hypothetical protein
MQIANVQHTDSMTTGDRPEKVKLFPNHYPDYA